ncbi:hypothetical protein [Haladaptatus sp. NG-SE-30]
MVVDSLTTVVVILAMGLGVAFTYFGYSVVTRLTSLVGGLGGALLGSFAGRTLVAPTVGFASPNVLLASLVGALVGSLVGSRIAHSTQRFAIVALSFAVSSAVAYSVVGHTDLLHLMPSLSPGSGALTPVVGSVVVGGIVGILVWQFYLPFLAVGTSLLGASILQRLVRHWSGSFPVFQSDVWASLGTNPVVWLLLVGTGIVYQYRRYRRTKSVSRRLQFHHRGSS